MGKIAVVFAGQGAQYSGMGKALCAGSSAARKVFEMADRLRPGTSALCFAGSKEELAQTLNTQPALFTFDLACARALEEAGVRADGAAGFSLGEMAALPFCGVLSDREAFELVMKRAEFMHACSLAYPGAMAAVLRLSAEQVERLCPENVYPVNYNCDGQTVVAGLKEALDAFIPVVNENGGRAVRLDVSGAFHTPFMADASEKLGAELENVSLHTPVIPLYANVTAKPYEGKPRDYIARQVASPVLWHKTVLNMIGDGFDTFIEAGAGKTLSGLIKRISPDVAVHHVEDGESLRSTLEALK